MGDITLSILYFLHRTRANTSIVKLGHGPLLRLRPHDKRELENYTRTGVGKRIRVACTQRTLYGKYTEHFIIRHKNT